MFYTAEIIVVGSEFFTRFKRDSNSLWLTEQLERRGVRVLAKRTVADDLGALADAYRDAASRVDLVISTGGLGPTEDDRTRDSVAAACEVALELRQEIIDDIVGKFASRGRTMTENNRRQAYIPEGASVLPNINGTAPGFHLLLGRATLLVLPGPPREMTALYESFSRERVALYPVDGVFTAARVLKVGGLGESDMDRRIADLYRDVANPEVTINFTPEDLEIHLTARAATASEAEALLEPMVASMAERLQGYLFSTTGQSLEEVVSGMLRARGETLALAESVTGGLVAHRFASIPGASAVFDGGVVAYTEQAKVALLGVEQSTLQAHTVFSPEVAQEMADGVVERLGADYGLSCTGVAGPAGGTEKDPVGTAYLGLCYRDECSVIRVSLPGDRNLIRARVAQAMIFWLYQELVSKTAAAG